MTTATEPVTATVKTHLEFRWTTSRGRDTYGYNVCTLYADGRKVARCNGGGYDMEGTCLGSYIASVYADRLNQLKPEDMPEQSHWEQARTKDGRAKYKGYRPLGKRVDDGRYFYGLTFHDPNYNPAKAVIGKDCNDRTLGDGAEGKTVEQAEADGVSFGLERYQAIYSASSKVPTDRHTVPSIDGGCGKRCVEDIAKAIGLTFEYIPTRSKKQTLYTMHDSRI